MFKQTRICKGLMLAFGGSILLGALPTQAFAQAQRVEITGSSIKRVEAEGALQVQTLTRADIDRTDEWAQLRTAHLVPADRRPPSTARGVHHVAWRLTDAAEELALREKIQRVGLQPSPKIDRFWFESVYFREPNGIVFELATDGPGFDRDEDMDHLGEELILPPWLEPQRAEIEAALPPINV